VNCGALPEALVESEFFGYVRGAFTGADREKDGLFQEARGGTLFLDEIAELPAGLQAKVLRAIETKEVRPVGSSRTVLADARVIAATNGDLEGLVRQGAFREDLYFRLNVLRIRVPPLRERIEDIPALAKHILERFRKAYRSPVSRIAPEGILLLQRYPWKGNVRELQNVLQRALITADGNVVDAPLLERLLGMTGATADRDLKKALRHYERIHIRQVVEDCGGDKAHAAKALGISLASLYSKLKGEGA
jgi:transcriptional regulator with PAS, ATPase and Fis domain